MSISWQLTSGGTLTPASLARLPYANLSFTVPDAFPGNLLVSGRVRGVGPQGGAATGAFLAEQSVAATLALPAVPVLGTTFYTVVVDVTTGTATLLSSASAWPVAVYPNQIAVARGVVRAGQILPWATPLVTLKPGPVPAAAPPAVTQTTWNPVDFGADPAGAGPCAAAINAASLAASNAGGGTVLYPPGTYRVQLDGTRNTWTLTMGSAPVWTGGTFTMSFGGSTTTPLVYNATAAALKAALAAAGVGLATPAVTRTGTGTAIDPYVYAISLSDSRTSKGQGLTADGSNLLPATLPDSSGFLLSSTSGQAQDGPMLSLYPGVNHQGAVDAAGAPLSTIKVDDQQGDWNCIMGPPGVNVGDTSNISIADLAFEWNVANNPASYGLAQSAAVYTVRGGIRISSGSNIRCRRLVFGPTSFDGWFAIWFASDGTGSLVKDSVMDSCSCKNMGNATFWHDQSVFWNYGARNTVKNCSVAGDLTKTGQSTAFEMIGAQLALVNCTADGVLQGITFGSKHSHDLAVRGCKLTNVLCAIPFYPALAAAGLGDGANMAHVVIDGNTFEVNQLAFTGPGNNPVIDAGTGQTRNPNVTTYRGAIDVLELSYDPPTDGVVIAGLQITNNVIRNTAPDGTQAELMSAIRLVNSENGVGVSSVSGLVNSGNTVSGFLAPATAGYAPGVVVGPGVTLTS